MILIALGSHIHLIFLLSSTKSYLFIFNFSHICIKECSICIKEFNY